MRKPGMEELSSAIADIYESVRVPALWPQALEGLVNLCGCAGVALFPVGGDPTRPVTSRGYVSPEVAAAGAAYLADWSENAPAMESLRRRPIIGRSTWDGAIVDRDIVRTHGFYRDFAHAHGLKFGAIRLMESGAMMLAPFSIATDIPRPGQLQIFEILSGHIERALAVAGHIASSGAHLAEISLASAGPDLGVIICAPDGAILEMNDVARSHVGDGLLERGGSLVLQDQGQNRAFQAALVANMRATIVRVDRPRSGTPLVIGITPAGRRTHPLLAEHSGRDFRLVTIVDPFRADRRDVTAALRALDLTPAEARIALEIAGSASLQSAARTLGLSVNTVRNHLKSIFLKLDVGRQSELVALISRLRGLPDAKS